MSHTTLKALFESIIETTNRNEAPTDRFSSVRTQCRYGIESLHKIEALVEPKVNEGNDVRTAEPNETPQFYGVYVRGFDGLAMHVRDYSNKVQADDMAKVLNDAINLIGL